MYIWVPVINVPYSRFFPRDAKFGIFYQQIILIMQVHVHILLTINPCPLKIIGIPLPNSKPAEKNSQTVMTIHKSIVHVPYVQHHVKE